MSANEILFPSRDTFFRMQRAKSTPHGGILHRVVAAEWEEQQVENFAESRARAESAAPVRRSQRKKKRQTDPTGIKLAGDGRSVNFPIHIHYFVFVWTFLNAHLP